MEYLCQSDGAFAQRKLSLEKNENKSLQNGAGEFIVNNFIEDVWKVMTPAMVERLKQILTEDFGLSKTDTNNFIQCQRDIRRKRICLKKTTREVRIGPRNQWIKELSKDIADQLAKFVVSILLSERNENTKKITEHILDRLCDVTGESTTIETAKTRVERILVVVADRLASWINENVSDIELQLKKQLGTLHSTLSSVICAPRKSSVSLQSSDFQSDVSDLSDIRRLKDSLVTFDSDILSVKDEKELISSEETDEKGSGDVQSSERSDSDESSEDDGDQTTTLEESEGGSSNEVQDEEEVESEMSEEEEESEKSETEVEESEEGKSEEAETEGEEEGEEEEFAEEEKSAAEEDSSLGDRERSEPTSILTLQDQMESEITGEGSPSLDMLDLLREDLDKVPKSEDKTDRQQALRQVIDNRLKEIAQEKLKRSLDSVIRYDIDETASIVANWVEKILASADGVELLPLVTEPKLGSAFEVMRGDGSQLRVQRISSTVVAKQVAELRGLDPPPRKKKLPRSMSPINIKSVNDWADWALGAADVGKEWDKWLDETLEDVERQLANDRGSKTGEERHEAWKEWREKKALEANKWRAEKRRIKAEGALWNRKLQKSPSEHREQETKAVTY